MLLYSPDDPSSFEVISFLMSCSLPFSPEETVFPGKRSNNLPLCWSHSPLLRIVLATPYVSMKGVVLHETAYSHAPYDAGIVTGAIVLMNPGAEQLHDLWQDSTTLRIRFLKHRVQHSLVPRATGNILIYQGAP